jgi:copper chaperone CopZ
MQKEFQVKGMTCQGCRAHVEEALQNIKGVKTANVNLENKTAEVEFHQDVSLEILQEAVGEKYDISEKKETSQGHEAENGKNSSEPALMQNEDSKLKQLKPLFLIFLYITSASLLINWSDFSLEQWMYDFMGMFFIVFSFFKFLDYKGFPASFKMYDPLAKVVPAYAWAYPFLETLLGLCFLFRFQIDFALIATLIVLGITTIGVSQSLFSKRKIKCACLGTALNLPMTEATFIENTIMIIMAIIMLIY